MRCFKRNAGIGGAKRADGFKRFKAENGSALIEYALVFMFLMSMLLGIMDFGRVLYSYHFLSNAARDATRWASVNGAACGAQTPSNRTGDNSCNGVGGMNNGPASEKDIQTYVTRITPPGVDPTNLTTTAIWPGCGGLNSPGCPVEVTISYKFNFAVPFIRSTPLTLSSSSQMIIVH
jgi:Flp pilus assembly protein TadG